MAREDAWPQGFERSIQNLASPFYAYNGLIASQHPARLQEILVILTGLFTGSSCRPTWQRQCAWYANRVVPLGGIQRSHTPGEWWERDITTGRGRGSDSITHNVG